MYDIIMADTCPYTFVQVLMTLRANLSKRWTLGDSDLSREVHQL